MRIRNLSIRNFRGFAEFDLAFDDKSAFLIGENGAGKSTVLTAIALALGSERGFVKQDFRDLSKAIEIRAVLREFTAEERGELAGAITFAEPPTLTLLARATWDFDLELIETEHLLPDKSDRRTKPDERAAIPLVKLSAGRDVGKMLAFGVRRNVLGGILDGVDLETDVEETTALVEKANERLSAAAAFSAVLTQVTTHLTRLRPGGNDEPLSIGHSAATMRELLSHLELRVADEGDPLALQYQSSGVGQLVLFAFLFHFLAEKPGTILLVDEPEGSLHPQAQRALMRVLDASAAQVVLSTHSSNLLERADPRRVIRLRRTKDSATISSPKELSEPEAKKLARFTNPQTAEAFFARAAVLVEGVSDKRALEALADRKNRNLDSLGVSIVPLGGGNTLAVFLRLLGKNGFQLNLLGLCDEDKEASWRKRLEEAGYGSVPDRAAMEALGFFVATRDLEDELIRVLGEERVLEIIASEEEADAWGTFRQQPDQREKTPGEQLRAFLATKDRKVRYAPALVDALDPEGVPRCLEEVLGRV